VSDRQLGVALLCVGAGALASMRAASTVIDRFRATAQPAALAVFAVTAALPGPARSPAARGRRRRHAEGLAEHQALGQVGLALTKRLFCAWHAFDEHYDRGRLAGEMAPIQTELRDLLSTPRATASAPATTAASPTTCSDLARAMDVRYRAGPRADQRRRRTLLRGPVIARELSHGTRTDDGEHFIARALSASVTCRLLGRSLFAYLADLLSAHAAAGRSQRTPEHEH
jgi:hypothetical protein